MRRRKAQAREIPIDPKYNSKVAAKFINIVMEKGKKQLAENIVYGAFEIMKQKLNDQDGLKLFHKAIDNVRPRLEVKPRRVGGATYQIPVEVRQDRGVSISLRWIRDFAEILNSKQTQISKSKTQNSCFEFMVLSFGFI